MDLAAKFDQLASRLIEDTWVTARTEVPDFVYHYTNAAGLLGILKSKRVWATDCRFLNDATESQIGLEIAKEMVKERSLTESGSEKRNFWELTHKVLVQDTDDKNFIFSLSSRGDDLTQWLLYANDGDGFTLGFDAHSIRQFSTQTDSLFSFGKVTYNEKTHRVRVRKALNLFEDYFEQHLDGNDAAEVGIEAAYNLDSVLSSYAAMFKHSSFQSEHEWRLNSYVDPGDPNDEIKVRLRDTRFVPYLEIDISSDGNLPLRKIGIGPGFKDAGVRYAVEKLCRQEHIEPEIYLADTPYRRS